MKKYNLLLFLFISTNSLFSQKYKKRTAEEKAKYYTDEMAKELSLDSITSSKVYEVNLIVSKRFDTLYAGSPDKDEVRIKAIQIYKQRDSSLKVILSKKEFLMFDDIQREKREKKKKEKEAKDQ